MPFAFTFTFKYISDFSMKKLHSAIFSFLSYFDKKLASHLHSSPLKPFTISIIDKSREEKTARISVLIDNLADTFKNFLDFRWADYGITPVLLDFSGEFTGMKTWGEFFDKDNCQRTITLRFITPTAFKKGEFIYLLPEPYLVFKSYFEKWKTYSNIPISADFLDKVKEKVSVSYLKLKTKSIDIGVERTRGFVGVCSFQVENDDEDFLVYMNALADFAEFAGTGRKTTYGMGLTKRIRENKTFLEEEISSNSIHEQDNFLEAEKKEEKQISEGR